MSSIARWSPLGLAVVGSLACLSGCVHEDSSGEARSAERSAVEESAPDAAVAPSEEAPAAFAAEPPPSFAEIERDLAANNAKLRALGVPLGDVTGGESQNDGELAQDAKPGVGGGGVGGGKAAGAPAPKPDPEPTAKPGTKSTTTAEKGADNQASRRDSKRDKAKEAKDRDADDFDGGDTPQPAKATPLSPSDVPSLDAAARCEQICDLSEISCSLGDQICELAERHPEQDDYASACERAIIDCDAAKEACDACTE